MKQVFYKSVLCLAVLSMLSGIIGASNSSACDKTALLRMGCKRALQKASPVMKVVSTEEHTDFIVTSTILRF